MDPKTLANAGLSPLESGVYLALLELGPSHAGEITRKSGIHRRSVYDALGRLIEKGLVSFLRQNNRMVYRAVNPTRLVNLLEERRDSLLRLMPELTALQDVHERDEDVSVFKGTRALKAVFDDQVRVRKRILVMNASINAADIVKYYFERFDRERKQKRIPIRMLFDESARATPYLKRIPLAEIRFLPKKFKNPTAINIYGDNVVIILWSDAPVAILIRSKIIAESYRKYFDLMWSGSRS